MSRRARLSLGLVFGLVAAVLATLGWARYASFHNETFDLAFYARMAWGLVRGSFWEPIVGAHVFGLHVSPVMALLGLLGLVLPVVPLLLVTQALAVAATAWPIARMGARRFGAAGVLLGAGAWLLYPNIGHVASYEFHPGTLAVLPMAWMLEGIDRGSARGMVLGAIGVLLCREDLALVTALAGLVAWRTEPGLATAGRWLAALSVAYVLLFVLVLHPVFGPTHGSMQLHFGKWGDSVPEALGAMITQPAQLFDHLTARERLLYLPKLLLPLALLPLLRPRWLVPALPLVGINLMSEWPTTTDMDSHYQTTLLPMLVVGAVDGAEVLARRLRVRWIVAGLLVTVTACHLMAGGTPIARDFEREAFLWDERSAAAARAVAAIPEGASVQASYALMPHLSQRLLFGPAPPPDRDYDYVVLDAWHRERYAQQEDLIRTTEEPTVRDWLAKEGYGLVLVEGPYLVLERGADPRGELVGKYLVGEADPEQGRRLAACLGLLDASVDERGLVLDLVARHACPRDLALRIGTPQEHRPRRVDLLFDGLLSPERLRRGDRARSIHPLTTDERERIAEHGLRLGALRQSGARPEHADPVGIDVDLE